MKKTEIVKLLAIVRAAYPAFYSKQGEEDTSAAVNLWHSMFADDDTATVCAAVKAFIAADTKGFPPTIGQIKDKLDKIWQEIHEKELTPVEAWGLVAKACKRSYYNAQEEFDKLPDTVRAVLGSAAALRDYAEMDIATLNSVVASNFQRSFASRRDYVVEMRKWPDSVKQLIESEKFKELGAWPGEEREALPDARAAVVDLNAEEV